MNVVISIVGFYRNEKGEAVFYCKCPVCGKKWKNPRRKCPNGCMDERRQ